MPEPSPDRHLLPKHSIRVDDDLWDELGKVVGEKRRSEVTRMLWAAFLKRPGAKIPRRKDYEPPET